MSNINSTLIALAETVPNGTSARLTCPECGGGKDRERSLQIRRDGLRAHCRCWRSSCGFGFRSVMLDGTTSYTPAVSQPAKQTRYEGDTEGIYTDTMPDMELHGFAGLCKLTEDGRVLLPVLDRHGQKRGEVVRQCKPYDTWRPKAMSYYDVDYDGMAWFFPSNEPIVTAYYNGIPPLCVVEDQLSAMRLASKGVIGVALLGTVLTSSKVATLRGWSSEHEGRPVHIALDADAYMQSVAQAKRLYNQLDMRVHRIFHDVKDMDDDELLNFLRVLGVYT